MQLTMPSEPTTAVSAAINTLSNLLQSKGALPPPLPASPEREGATYPDEIVLFNDIAFNYLMVIV